MVGEGELEVHPKDFGTNFCQHLDFQIVFRHVINIKLWSQTAKCCSIDFGGGGALNHQTNLPNHTTYFSYSSLLHVLLSVVELVLFSLVQVSA